MPRDSPYPSASLGPIQGARVYKLGSLVSGLWPLVPDTWAQVTGTWPLVPASELWASGLWPRHLGAGFGSIAPVLPGLGTRAAGLGPRPKRRVRYRAENDKGL